ncbi:hypothetical protein DYH10_04240 [Candidatus Saccharibacteria bacterium CPR2]|nr:hypothetical protein [Candidatus Saccharibacteria bacterium CPR2]
MSLTWQNKEPLFPDILWSRPENKKLAGKILLIGGNKNSFNLISTAFANVNQAGVGEARVVLPDSLKPLLQDSFKGQVFVPSTKTSEISREATQEIISLANDANGILLPGDIGKNSETSTLVLDILKQLNQQITLSGDSLQLISTEVDFIVTRNNTCLVPNFSQLQQLFKQIRYPKPVISTMPVQALADILAEFTSLNSIIIVTKHNNQVLVARGGKVSATKHSTQLDDWQVKTATLSSVFWLQNPGKPFEAITTGIFCASNNEY